MVVIRILTARKLAPRTLPPLAENPQTVLPPIQISSVSGWSQTWLKSNHIKPLQSMSWNPDIFRKWLRNLVPLHEVITIYMKPLKS